MEESAKRLKLLLDETGMKQQELADKSGLHKSKISKYLKGEYCPKADAAQSIAEVFNVNPVWLMGLNVSREIPKNETDNPKQILRGLKFVEKFDNASPHVQEAIRSLLELSQSDL